ncbi:LacI family transcriptional regulator [Melghirimyces profundicolus]|uniref:LacI family transcriptional regulator n=1 Tax=Melghirimyces profundicolus TaxID=1242148 RepID=A0A2T6BD31_9BACL|nr:LacI family DNA-binding transcriptional regulator [Melghirimyces profundicolus]PTX53973.1 LacI family transcriptional regulator [Melghirimyces profundicolus]
MGVTIKDIAKAAGVSYSTVSKALRDSPLVKPQTKQKILTVAKEMGYQPNIAAKSLVSKKSNTIGVVWPTVERDALSALATKINDELEKHHYHMLLSINPIHSAVNVFNRFQVDAILVFSEKAPPNVLQSAVPILFYGEPGPSSYPTFNVNRRQAVKKAVEYLYQLGHRKIAYIGDLTKQNKNQQEKLIGFQEGCKDLHLSPSDTITVNTNGLNWQDGYQAAEQMLDICTPTAIIGGSYDISVGILRAVKKAQLKVPADISLISYDNIPQSANQDPPLTVTGAPIEKIAEQMIKSLLTLIRNESLEDIPTLDSELVIRNSCTSLRMIEG